jgi:hypothetical protein
MSLELPTSGVAIYLRSASMRQNLSRLSLDPVLVSLTGFAVSESRYCRSATHRAAAAPPTEYSHCGCADRSRLITVALPSVSTSPAEVATREPRAVVSNSGTACRCGR